MTAAAPAKAAWVSTTSSKSRPSPAWETLDNERIKAPPPIKGLKAPAPGEPEPCDDFKTPMTGGKASQHWLSDLRSDGKREAGGKPGFWSPGTGRGAAAHPAGGTRGTREGKRGSVANLLPQFPPPLSGGDAMDLADEKKNSTKEVPCKYDIDTIFSYLVCEEKQDADIYPKARSFPKKRYGKEEKQEEASSPGGRSALSTQCSTPHSPGAGWVRSPFTPRRGQGTPWDELEGRTLIEI